MNRRTALFLALAVALVLMPVTLAGPSDPSDFTRVVLKDISANPGQNGQIIHDPGNTGTLWACIGLDDTYFAESTDSGQSWSLTTLNDGWDGFEGCGIDAWSSDRIAVSYSQGGDTHVSVSTDGGSSWSETTVWSTASDTAAVIWTSSTDLVAVRVTDDSPPDLTSKTSTDTGSSWSTDTVIDPVSSDFSATQPLFSMVRNLPDTPTTVRIIYPDSGASTVVSTDSGSSWSTTTTANLTGSSSNVAWRPISDTNWVAAYQDGSGDTRFAETTDSGATWTEVRKFASISGPVHDIDTVGTDNHAFIWRNGSCTAGVCSELYWSLDDGATWTNVEAMDSSTASTDAVFSSLVVPRNDAYAVLSVEGDAEQLWESSVSGDFTTPGLDVLTPESTETNHAILRDVRTDWTLDNEGHEVYVREVGLSQIGGRALVYDPSLTRLRAGSPCQLGDGAEDPAMKEFAVTKEFNERLVWPCLANFGGDFDEEDAYLLSNGTDFQPVNVVDMEEAVSADWSNQMVACTDANSCVAKNREDTHLVRFDPLNGRIAWSRGFAGIQDADVDLNQTTRFAATGASGTRLYGPSAAVQTTRADLNFDAVALWGSKVWIGDGPGIRQYNISGNTLNFCCGNTSIPVTEGALRTSKDGNWLIAWNTDQAWVVEPDSLRAVVNVNPSTAAGEGLVSADMDLNNSALYVVNKTTLFAYDLTGTNVTAGTTPQPPATNGTESVDVTPPDLADDNNFSTLFLKFTGSIFGVKGQATKWVAAGLLILVLTGACVITFSKFRVEAQWSIVCGLVGGVAISLGLGWIPVWSLALLALAALAVLGLTR